MSYPEDEHSITVDEQCLSEFSSVVDEHFPATELTIHKRKHKEFINGSHSWNLKMT